MRFNADFWRELQRLRILARRLYAPSRIKRLKKIGTGLELADRRPYTPYDETRYIDWRYYARSEKLNLRLFEEERELLYLVILDTSDSMEEKFDTACRITLAISDLALNAGDRVALAFASDGELTVSSAAKGASATNNLLQPLETAKPSGRTSLAASLTRGLDSTKGVSAILLVSDFFDENWRSALSLAQNRSIPLLLVAVHAEQDYRTPQTLQDFLLLDSETAERLELAVDGAVETALKEEFEKFCGELREAVRESGAEIVFAKTEVGFAKPVEELLNLGYFLP